MYDYVLFIVPDVSLHYVVCIMASFGTLLAIAWVDEGVLTEQVGRCVRTLKLLLETFSVLRLLRKLGKDK
jgi:hypothetical protein